jgi:putative cardiolipin synthase
MFRLRRWTAAALLALCTAAPAAASDAALAYIDAQIAANPGKTGAYVLDAADEALLARTRLADHARESIEVQYFI